MLMAGVVFISFVLYLLRLFVAVYVGRVFASLSAAVRR